MTSTFTNIIVSDSVVSDTVTTDTLNCNYLAINATDIGATTLKCNTLLPFTGNTTTLGASNVIVQGNIIINGNIGSPFSGNINIVKLRAYQDTELAYNNINNKVKVRNTAGSSYINFYQNPNITSEVINGYIECFGYGSNPNTAWGADLSFGASNVDIGIPVFSKFVRLYGYENQVNGNLSVSGLSTFTGNANIIGNLRVNNSSNFIGNTTFNSLNTFSGNTTFTGNVVVNRNINFLGNVNAGNIETGLFTSTGGTSIAKANVASQIVMDTSGEITLIDLYSHSNISNIFPDSRIVSVGGLSNTAGSGTLFIGSRNCFMGTGSYTPQGGGGNITLNYNSSNITGNLYCNRMVDINENLMVNGNLQVDKNTTMLGNLTVGNVLINNILSLTGNINTSNVNASGNASIGNLLVTGFANLNSNARLGTLNVVGTSQFDDGVSIANNGDLFMLGTGKSLRLVNDVNHSYIQCGNVGGGAGSAGNLFVGNFLQNAGASARKFMIRDNGNVGIQNINPQYTLDITGDLNVSNKLNYSDILHSNVRIGEAWGGIFLATPTIASGGFVPFAATAYGTLDQIDTTNRWIRVNKNGKSLTVGVRLTIIFEIGTGFTNTTTGAFQVQTSTNSTFTAPVARTLARVIGTFTASQVVERTLDFIMPTTEEYFRVIYNGNATFSFVGGQANAYLSRYSVRTFF